MPIEPPTRWITFSCGVALGELGALERGERRRHRRQEAKADPDAAHEHRHRQPEDRRVGADQAERNRRDRAQDHAEQRQPAAAPAVGQLAGDRHRERRAETLRRGQQARCRRRSRGGRPASTAAAGSSRRTARRRGRTSRTRPRRRSACRYRRMSSSGFGTRSAWSTNAATSAGPDDARDDDLERSEAAGRADLGETVGEQREARGHQEQAARIELLDLLALDPGQVAAAPRTRRSRRSERSRRRSSASSRSG